MELEAKSEFTMRLSDLLIPFIYEGLCSIWQSAKQECVSKNTPRQNLVCFQNKLRNVPRWNQEIIDKEFNRFKAYTDIVMVDKLLECLFVSYVHILSTIRNKSSINSLKIHLPETSVFLHRCYINCARRIFTEPHLMDDRRVPVKQVHVNFYKICEYIRECINTTVRENLPLKDLMFFENKEEPEIILESVDRDEDSGVEDKEHEDSEVEDSDPEEEEKENPTVQLEGSSVETGGDLFLEKPELDIEEEDKQPPEDPFMSKPDYDEGFKSEPDLNVISSNQDLITNPVKISMQDNHSVTNNHHHAVEEEEDFFTD